MKLNSFLIILFIILKQIYAQCFEPIDEKRVKKVACGKWVTEKDINKVKINNNNKLVGGNETMFQVTFTCSTSDTVMCTKAQRAFVNAGNTIANTLKFKEKVLINATLMDFCAEENIETCALKHHIGLAGPQRLYSLLSDDDKIERIYPQALVKQFQFPEHPQYDEFDIFIRFNSRMDFYFTDDTTPIGPLQYDFEFTAIHELLHGLGFISYWQPYDEANNLKALCPAFALLNSGNDGAFDDIGENDLVTVKESIFDKYIIRLDKGTSITEYTKNIEQYVVNNQNATEEEFLQNLFPTMNEVYTLATTPKILGFLPHNSNVTDAVILETSIKYLAGSSLTHVDLSTYNNTSDYLMAYKSTPGKTVNDFISIGGNYSGGVIGPKTKSVLETIGYATESYPDPIKPQPFVKPQANLNSAAISSISNSVIFSQCYILICIIIILL